MSDNIFKVWGTRRRILVNDLVEVDHLQIKKDHCCSVHYHQYKSNRFYVISGKCKIKTELNEIVLGPNEVFDVHPLIVHHFHALEDTVMIECAYVKLDQGDINRHKQGGKIIDDEWITEDQMRKDNENKNI